VQKQLLEIWQDIDAMQTGRQATKSLRADTFAVQLNAGNVAMLRAGVE